MIENKSILDSIRGYWNASIKHRLILGVVLTHLILILFFITGLVIRQSSFLKNQIMEQTEALARSLSANSVSWVLADDVIGLEEVVLSQKNYPNLKYAMILSPEGKVLGHTDSLLVGSYIEDSISLSLLGENMETKYLVNDSNIIDIGVPVMIGDLHIAWSRVAISQEVLNLGLHNILFYGLWYALLAMLTGIIFAIIMARGIINGITQLLVVTKKVEQGELSARVTEIRPDEIGQLGLSFNNMIDKIKQSMTELEQAQSEKMESISQLAGGIAHNFNNVLQGIMSSVQVLQLPNNNINEKNRKYTDIIIQLSMRASELVKELLSFSGKKMISKSSLDLHRILDDATDILYNTMDIKTSISLQKDAKHNNIFGDPVELKTVFVNLGLNALYEMKDGEVLKFITENVYLDKGYCDSSLFDIKPGEYCKITVSDTGSGIQAENINKIFEPFFTTKEQGKGTGLGLSFVYGSMKDHYGEIRVSSKVGIGTSFYLLLPVYKEKALEKKESLILSGSGKILLVDDEDFNRSIGKDILESLGYKVLLAKDGLESVEIFKNSYSEIDIVIMDMVMPVMNGSEAFYKMKEIDENCKVIISSGHAKDENIDTLIKNGLVGFINKPYKISAISQLLNNIQKL